MDVQERDRDPYEHQHHAPAEEALMPAIMKLPPVATSIGAAE